MSSACVLWFPWPHLCSGVRQINQLDGIEYVAAGAARELPLKTPECRDGKNREPQERQRCDLSMCIESPPIESVLRVNYPATVKLPDTHYTRRENLTPMRQTGCVMLVDVCYEPHVTKFVCQRVAND